MKCLVAPGKGEVLSSFFTASAISKIESLGEVVYNKTGRPNFTKQELIDNISDVDVVFTGWGTPALDKDVIMAAKKLKIHAHTGGAVASYISKEEYDAGVKVISGNNIFAKSVAEGCLCYTLAALRRLPEYVATVNSGGWQPEIHKTQGLIGKKIGLIGYGTIAQHYAQLLKWFSPQLFISSSFITDEELNQIGAQRANAEEIFASCDIISFHSALNEKTKAMFNKDMLSKIKDGALFVNTSRAGLFQEHDLYEELQKKRFNAVLDVYHTEPLPQDSILRSLPNVMLLPHVAGPTFDMREKVVIQLAEDILKIYAGESVQSLISYDYAIRMTVN